MGLVSDREKPGLRGGGGCQRGGNGRQVREALRETPTVELRLDWLRNDVERGRMLAWVAQQKFSGVALMATCRRYRRWGEIRAGV